MERQTTEEVLKWYTPRDPDWSKLNNAVDEHAKKAPKPALINIYAARKGGATYSFEPIQEGLFSRTRRIELETGTGNPSVSSCPAGGKHYRGAAQKS